MFIGRTTTKGDDMDSMTCVQCMTGTMEMVWNDADTHIAPSGRMKHGRRGWRNVCGSCGLNVPANPTYSIMCGEPVPGVSAPAPDQRRWTTWRRGVVGIHQAADIIRAWEGSDNNAGRIYLAVVEDDPAPWVE